MSPCNRTVTGNGNCRPASLPRLYRKKEILKKDDGLKTAEKPPGVGPLRTGPRAGGGGGGPERPQRARPSPSRARGGPRGSRRGEGPAAEPSHLTVLREAQKHALSLSPQPFRLGEDFTDILRKGVSSLLCPQVPGAAGVPGSAHYTKKKKKSSVTETRMENVLYINKHGNEFAQP